MSYRDDWLPFDNSNVSSLRCYSLVSTKPAIELLDIIENVFNLFGLLTLLMRSIVGHQQHPSIGIRNS